MNTLYYGDNLNILQRYIKDASVDLVYLDPPSSANRGQQRAFKDESGLEADSPIMAFQRHVAFERCGLDPRRSQHDRSQGFRIASAL